jgi:hypothetical protein
MATPWNRSFGSGITERPSEVEDVRITQLGKATLANLLYENMGIRAGRQPLSYLFERTFGQAIFPLLASSAVLVDITNRTGFDEFVLTEVARVIFPPGPLCPVGYQFAVGGAGAGRSLQVQGDDVLLFTGNVANDSLTLAFGSVSQAAPPATSPPTRLIHLARVQTHPNGINTCWIADYLSDRLDTWDLIAAALPTFFRARITDVGAAQVVLVLDADLNAPVISCVHTRQTVAIGSLLQKAVIAGRYSRVTFWDVTAGLPITVNDLDVILPGKYAIPRNVGTQMWRL